MSDEPADPLDEIERVAEALPRPPPTHERLPGEGRPREEVLAEMEAMAASERDRWQEGYVSGAVYHGDREHIDFLNRVYALHSQSNPLHADLWPSATKFEAEIVAMTADMLGAGEHAATRSSAPSPRGGTESILLAMKTYRDRRAAGIERPEMVAARHRARRLRQGGAVLRHRAGARARRAGLPRRRGRDGARPIDRDTVVVVGSAPSFPHGVIDPIEELSELARERGIGFHTDACLGGFVLPWAERLGYPVPPFDFRLPGVTSMSADTHKFGYAAKGTSVVLYRGAELRHAPVLHGHRVAGRPLLVADVRRQPARRAQRGLLGRDGVDRRGRLPRRRRAASSRPRRRSRRGIARHPRAARCSATRSSSSPSRSE